jgi:hypothetical protein
MSVNGQHDAAEEPVATITNPLVLRAEAEFEGRWPTWRQDTGAPAAAKLPHDAKSLQNLVRSFNGSPEAAYWLRETADWLADVAALAAQSPAV